MNINEKAELCEQIAELSEKDKTFIRGYISGVMAKSSKEYKDMEEEANSTK